MQDRQVEQSRLGAGEEAEARRDEASLPLRPRSSRGWPLVQLPLLYGVRNTVSTRQRSGGSITDRSRITSSHPGQLSGPINQSVPSCPSAPTKVVTYSATNNQCSDFPCENKPSLLLWYIQATCTRATLSTHSTTYSHVAAVLRDQRTSTGTSV